MKKIEYIESIKYRLKSYNETIRNDNALIEVAIDRVYSDLMYKMYANDDPMDLYTKRYKEEIQYDDGEFYINLPSQPVLLPKQAGVYYVKTLSGKSLVPLNSIEVDIYNDLGVNRVDDKGTYYVDANKIYLQMYDDMNIIKYVYVGIIRTFKSYDELEEIYMPKQTADVLTNQVLEFFLGKGIFDDMINDNSDNTLANATE